VKPYSITHRLITTVLLVELLAAISISGAALFYERHVRFRAFDVMLRGRADSLLGAVQDAEDTQDNIMLDGTEANLPTEDIYQVEDASGRVLGHSQDWAGMPSASTGEVFRVSAGGKHYRALRIEGLRVVDPGDKGGGIPRRVLIFYGAPTDRVWSEIWEAVGFYAATSIGLLAISGMLIFFVLNRGLAPLRELAAEAAGVSDGRTGDSACRARAILRATASIYRRCRARAQNRRRRAEVVAATRHAEAENSTRV
jgi:hypothetical protein